MEALVAPVFHRNDAVGVPLAVNTELPQLSVTETDGAMGTVLTVKTIALEFIVPAILVHTARYCLLLSDIVVVNDNVPDVAPLILFQLVPLVLSCHCTVGAGLPLASERKITLSPAHFVCAVGCVITEGDAILPPTPTVTNTFWVFEHAFAVNVYTYVTVTGDAVVLVNVSFILPVPFAVALLIPATAARLQAYVVPEVLLPGI